MYSIIHRAIWTIETMIESLAAYLFATAIIIIVFILAVIILWPAIIQENRPK